MNVIDFTNSGAWRQSTNSLKSVSPWTKWQVDLSDYKGPCALKSLALRHVIRKLTRKKLVFFHCSFRELECLKHETKHFQPSGEDEAPATGWQGNHSCNHNALLMQNIFLFLQNCFNYQQDPWIFRANMLLIDLLCSKLGYSCLWNLCYT